VEKETQQALTQVVDDYFQGLYNGKTELLKKAFDESAIIFGYGSDGALKQMTREMFLGFVASVPKPVESGEIFDMEVLEIEQKGKIASIKVRDLYLGRMFTDYLQLVQRGDGQWRIFSKAFHSEPV